MTTGVILSIVAITIGFRFGSPYGLGTLAAEKALHSETLTAMQRRA
jgi:hypothetical protein